MNKNICKLSGLEEIELVEEQFNIKTPKKKRKKKGRISKSDFYFYHR